MNPNTISLEATDNSINFFRLSVVLKIAAILIGINLMLAAWFWLSPNWNSSMEEQRLVEGQAMAESKPSPFYELENEAKRSPKKAMKLQPIVVRVEPEVETALTEPLTSEVAGDSVRHESDHSLLARYAETRSGDRP